MEKISLVLKPPTLIAPPEMARYNNKPPILTGLVPKSYFEVENVKPKAPQEVIKNDEILRGELSPETRQKLEQAENSAQIIIDKFCNLYGFDKIEIPIFLANLKLSILGQCSVNLHFKYISLNKNFIESKSLKSIVSTIIHEIIHFLSYNLQKGKIDSSNVKITGLTQVGLAYNRPIKKELQEKDKIGKNLNEAFVETVTNIISFENKEEYLKNVRESGYSNIVKPVLKLMEYLEQIEKNNAKEFFDLMVKTLKEGKPYLIIRFLKEKTGVELKPPELLAADFSRILAKEKLEIELPNVKDLQVIGEYKFNGLIPDQKICFQSPNLVMRIIDDGIILDSNKTQNFAYLSFDKFGNFGKVNINDENICSDVLNKESNFPLRNLLETELKKIERGVEIPYFGSKFWQNSPEK